MQGKQLTVLKHEDLVGRTFPTDTKETGERSQAKVVEVIQQHNHKTKTEPGHMKFWCSINNGEYEEIFS